MLFICLLLLNNRQKCPKIEDFQKCHKIDFNVMFTERRSLALNSCKQHMNYVTTSKFQLLIQINWIELKLVCIQLMPNLYQRLWKIISLFNCFSAQTKTLQNFLLLAKVWTFNLKQMRKSYKNDKNIKILFPYWILLVILLELAFKQNYMDSNNIINFLI